jgi:hypothetical protein
MSATRPRSLLSAGLLLAFAGWLATLPAQRVCADGAAAGPDSAYQENIQRGLDEFGLEHWSEARVFFAQAHALQPSARTLRGLGLTSYELRDYVEAVRYMQESLASQARPLTEEMRVEMHHILERAQRFVSRLRVQRQPAAASVSIDGKPATYNAEGEVLLNPGSHEVVANAAGFESAQQTVLAQGGDALEVQFGLRPTRPSVSASAPRRGARGKAGPWIAFGASAALAVTGAALLGVAASDVARVEDARKGTAWSDVESANDRAPKLSAAGFALLGVGVAGAAAALAWRFWPDKTHSGAQAVLRVAPTGLRLTGTF